jgi:hypothetical protein
MVNVQLISLYDALNEGALATLGQNRQPGMCWIYISRSLESERHVKTKSMAGSQI